MPAAAGERALLWAVLLCAALVSLVSILLGAWLLFRRRDLLGRGRTAVLPRVVVAGLLIGISVLSVLPDALDALVAAGWRTEAVLLCGSAAPPAPRPTARRTERPAGRRARGLLRPACILYTGTHSTYR